MPIFEFIADDGEVAEAITLPSKNVIEINGKRYRKAPVQSFATPRGLKLPDQKEQVKKGYSRLEDKGGYWPSRYSKNTIRKAWGI